MTDGNDFPIAIVDRIEAGIVVLEAIEPKINFKLPEALLPSDIHEGAAVELGFRLRPGVEEERRNYVSDLQQSLMEKPDQDK
jgi:hypothetical protein